jgi:predicted outer membrane protein
LFFAIGHSDVVGAERRDSSARAFLAWAIQVGIQQEDMGRLAAGRAQRAEVKGLGRYLVERHREGEERLQVAARQANVQLSKKLSATHLRIQRRYAAIPDAEFDQAFIRHEIGDYRYFLSHFQAAAISGNQVIREYATKEIGSLKQDQAKIMAIASAR